MDGGPGLGPGLGPASPAPLVHVRQLLLREAAGLRAVRRVQQRGVGAQRQAEPGPERLQVLHYDPLALHPVPHQDRDGDPAARQQLQRLQAALRPGSLHLVAVVLEPDLHLVRGEADQPGQVLPLRGGQVALLPEATLQLEGLRLGEENPPLPAAAPWRVTARGGLVRGQVRGLGLGAGLEGETVDCRRRGQVMCSLEHVICLKH